MILKVNMVNRTQDRIGWTREESGDSWFRVVQHLSINVKYQTRISPTRLHRRGQKVAWLEYP